MNEKLTKISETEKKINTGFPSLRLTIITILNFNLVIKLILTLLFFTFVVDTTLSFSKMIFFTINF